MFAALADPNRRRIVELLVAGGPDTATGLAAELDITRQATAKHLSLLAGAGLASPARVGRETRFRIDTTALAEVSDWVTRVESDWTQRLTALANSIERDQT